ncbi:MAG: lipid A biosynthesis acyltransferase, partial [Burkholderiaceae bacterium]|nr:lipid A biosynthesis acyltransferase [Burkholderiaceae bacterium]
PSSDLQADVCRMNQVLEQLIQDMPEQYYWVHQRFKTRPPGEASPYAR